MTTVLSPDSANRCSSDATYAVGTFGVNAVYWNTNTNIRTALTHPSTVAGHPFATAVATDTQDDGSHIAGYATNTFVTTGFAPLLWDRVANTFSTANTTFEGLALAISGNGSYIVGRADWTLTNSPAAFWDTATLTENFFGNVGAGTSTYIAQGISGDNTVAVGIASDGTINQPVWWTVPGGVGTAMSWPAGFTSGTLSSGFPTLGQGPLDCSLHGDYIVGTAFDNTTNFVNQPVWWDKATGTPHLLHTLGGGTGGGSATGIDDAGSVISGFYTDDVSGNQFAVTWDRASGAITSLAYATGSSANNAAGNGISANGLIVVGNDNLTVGGENAVFWPLSVGPGTPLALVGRGQAGSRGRAAPPAILTIMRGRLRAGGRGYGLGNWPGFDIHLVGRTLAGAGAGVSTTTPQGPFLKGTTRAGGQGGLAPISGINPTPIFPTLPIGFPVTVTPGFASVSGQSPAGRQMRASQQGFPTWNFDFNFEVLRDQTQNAISDTYYSGMMDFMKLVQVFLASVGQYGQFLFDAWWDDSREDQLIATGDGHTIKFLIVRTWGYGSLAFNEPVGGINTVTNVKINGVVQTPGTWAIEDNDTFLVFASAPGSGLAITMTFSYYYRCQFAEDQVDFSEFLSDIWSTKIKLRTVYPRIPFALLPAPWPPTPGPNPGYTFSPSQSQIWFIARGGSLTTGILMFGDVGQPQNAASLPGYWTVNTTALSPYVSGLIANEQKTNLSEAGFSGSWGVYNATPYGDIAVGINNSNACWWEVAANAPHILTPPDPSVSAALATCCSSGAQYIFIYCVSHNPSGPPTSFRYSRTDNTYLQLNSNNPTAGAVGVLGCSYGGDIVVGFANSGPPNVSLTDTPAFWRMPNPVPNFLGDTSINNPTGNGSAYACSQDGTIIVGSSVIHGIGACWWNINKPDETVFLDLPPGADPTVSGVATSCSANGDIIGGYVQMISSGQIAPVVWIRSTGQAFLLPFATPWPALAIGPNPTTILGVGAVNCISADGTLAGGWQRVQIGSPPDFEWATYWDLTRILP